MIELTLIESEEQIVSGIPKHVTIESSTPCTIFYTLDGTDPSTFSSVFIDKIIIQIDAKIEITLKYYATTGSEDTEIITKKYFTNNSKYQRVPHSAVIGIKNEPSNYPFGVNSTNSKGIYIGTQNAGITVDSPLVSNKTSLPDGNGGNTAETDKDLSEYDMLYSSKNQQGEPIFGIGNLPSHTKIEPTKEPPIFSSKNDKFFNPKALVIFQDSRYQDPLQPPVINKQYFTMVDNEKNNNNIYSSNLDAPSITGSFVRSHYNPSDNTYTYYYYDNNVSRWIISKEPNLVKPETTELYSMVFGRGNSKVPVFQWHLFRYRTLF